MNFKGRDIFSPGPRSVFEIGTRLSAILFVFLSIATLISNDSIWIVPFLCFGTLSIFRMPSKELLFQQVLAYGGLALLMNEFHFSAIELLPLVLGSMLTFLMCFIAPENGRYVMNGLDRYFISQDYEGMTPITHHLIDSQSPFDRRALVGAIEYWVKDLKVTRTFIRESCFGVERFYSNKLWICPQDLLVWLEHTVDKNEEARLLQGKFDLKRRPPLMIYHYPLSEGGYRLSLSVHHSLTDGSGGFLLLDQLLKRYNEIREGSPLSPSPIEPEPKKFRKIFKTKGIFWLLRMIRQHVRPLDKVGVKNASLLENEDPQPTITQHLLFSLGHTESELLKCRARDLEISRNDYIVAAALRAADQWRSVRGKQDRDFRVLLPTDLRSVLGLPISFQNFVGVVRAVFSPDEVRSDGFARIVSKRIKLGKKLEDAIETPINLGTLSRVLPPAYFRYELKKFDNDPKSFYFSLLITNVRSPLPLSLPNNSKSRVWVRASIPRQPGIGLTITEAQGQIHFACVYLEPLLSETAAKEYFQYFQNELAAQLVPSEIV